MPPPKKEKQNINQFTLKIKNEEGDIIYMVIFFDCGPYDRWTL